MTKEHLPYKPKLDKWGSHIIEQEQIITTGVMSNTRRIRICRNFNAYNEPDDRLVYMEREETFWLKLPNGLIAIISRGGSYTSYKDNDGIVQEMTKELAVDFDNFLVELTGITSNKGLTN